MTKRRDRSAADHPPRGAGLSPPDRADPVEIGILLTPGAQLAAVHGLTDLCQVANRVAAQRGTAGPVLRVSHWQAAGRGAGRVFDSGPVRPGQPAVLIAPPSLGDLPPPDPTLARWLVERHAAGATLASVCAGAFLLAQTGLLAGRAVTTHWAHAETLAARFPDIRVAADRLIIDDGDIITAGGLMAWTDLGLTLVGRWLGSAVMLETARILLVDPPGRDQRCYSLFVPRLTHGDPAVLKVQHWLQAEGARDVTVAAMAERAGLEPRTFLRRFHRATGLRPTEYCQQLRISRARGLLETTGETVDRIAWTVGYADPAAFRKLFRRVTGLPPGDYRRRFGSAVQVDPVPD